MGLSVIPRFCRQAGHRKTGYDDDHMDDDDHIDDDDDDDDERENVDRSRISMVSQILLFSFYPTLPYPTLPYPTWRRIWSMERRSPSHAHAASCKRTPRGMTGPDAWATATSTPPEMTTMVKDLSVVNVVRWRRPLTRYTMPGVG